VHRLGVLFGVSDGTIKSLKSGHRGWVRRVSADILDPGQIAFDLGLEIEAALRRAADRLAESRRRDQIDRFLAADPKPKAKAVPHRRVSLKLQVERAWADNPGTVRE
jgi:hypothetical protein